MALQIWTNPNVAPELVFAGGNALGQGLGQGISKLGDAIGQALEKKKAEGQEATSLRKYLTSRGVIDTHDANVMGLEDLRGLLKAKTDEDSFQQHDIQRRLGEQTLANEQKAPAFTKRLGDLFSASPTKTLTLGHVMQAAADTGYMPPPSLMSGAVGLEQSGMKDEIARRNADLRSQSMELRRQHWNAVIQEKFGHLDEVDRAGLRAQLQALDNEQWAGDMKPEEIDAKREKILDTYRQRKPAGAAPTLVPPPPPLPGKLGSVLPPQSSISTPTPPAVVQPAPDMAMPPPGAGFAVPAVTGGRVKVVGPHGEVGDVPIENALKLIQQGWKLR